MMIPRVVTSIAGNYMDVTGPEVVEILVKTDGKTIWINIDGICRLRACRIKKLVVKDERKEKS